MMKKQSSRRMAIAALLLVLVFISITMTGCGLVDGKKYKAAVELFENSQYDEAIAAFSEIKEYEDSSTYIMYIKTLQLAESGEYALAASTFEAMNDFKDSKYFSVYYSGRQAEKEQRYEDADALYRTIAVFSDCTARLKALPDLILERDFDIAANGLKDECWDEEDAAAFASLVLCVYSDSPNRMLQNIYDLADKILKNGNYEVAKELFLLLSEKEYGNASIRVQECRFEYAKVMLKKEEYEDAAAFIQTYLRDYEEASAVYATIPDLVLRRDFDKAAAGLYDGEYSNEDHTIFKAFSTKLYSDSDTRMLQDIYDHADTLLSLGEYKIALKLFGLTDKQNFYNSSERILDCHFEHVKSLMNAGQYSEACAKINAYLSDYAAPDNTFKKCFYYYAEECCNNNLYDTAYFYYKKAEGYSDAADKAAKFELSYQSAKELMAIGKYEEAYSAFTALCDYSDSHDCASESLYLHADSLFTNGELQKAYKIFIALAEYKDSAQRAIDTNTAIWDARYDAADQLLADKKFEEAIAAFVALDGYKDSAGKIEEAKTAILDIQYATADQLLTDKKYAEAIAAFAALDGYRDSEEKIENASTEMLAARYLEVEPIAFHLDGIPYVDEEKIKFSWGVEFDAASYTITLEYEDGTVYPLSSSNEKTLTINTRNLQTGLYKLRVGAVPAENNNENILWNELQFGVIPSITSSTSPGLPVIVPLGTSYNFHTEIDSSGTARRLNSEYPYEVLDLTMQVISHKDPEYFKENYDDTYVLQGNEAAVEFVITLNDYNGSSQIIPQNILLISVLGADQSTTSQGFQLMNTEIGGKTEVAIDNNSPATLYKRYSHSIDMGDAAYLVVTSYIDGEEYIYWFETFDRNNIAEKESLPIYIPHKTPDLSSGKSIIEGTLYPNGNLDVNGFAIKIDDHLVTEDPVLLTEGKFKISWVAETEIVNYSIYLYDGSGNLINRKENTTITEMSVDTSSMMKNQIYTLKVGALPENGIEDDRIWQEINLLHSLSTITEGQ